MNKEISFGIVGILVGVILVSFFGSVAPFRSMMWGVNSPNNVNSLNNFNKVDGKIPARNFGMMNNIDQHFIEQMIPHHDGAIAMANLALQKSKKTEIKTLAKNIIESQSKEIKDMQTWYKSWFGFDVKEQNTFGMMRGGMMSQGGMHMGGLEDTRILENALDFDRAFIETMIPHHQMAIMMAQMLKSGTNRPEMLNLANNIIESQSGEIADMQAWYEVWYK